MISRLIDLSLRHRAIVLVLSLFLVAAGIHSARTLTVDAIPDLSDVQVIVTAEWPGRAPQIIEDQVTYPLAQAMLSVPGADVVRAYSMFGSSFVYIIFDDGTDLYWARARVLEQLSTIGSRLPEGVSPRLGPDATGVGWVYEYVLTTGHYCPKHPQGVWHDAESDRWYEAYPAVDSSPAQSPPRTAVHHRAFGTSRTVYAGSGAARFDRRADAPESIRDSLAPIEVAGGHTHCPIDGEPLVPADADLAELRGLQDWYLRLELVAVDGVSEVASAGGFVKQYQVAVDPVRLLALGVSLRDVREALERSNLDIGGASLERGETEYMVRGLGTLGTLSHHDIAQAHAQGLPLSRARTARVLADLRGIPLRAGEGAPVTIQDVASVRVGPDMRRGIVDWNGEGEAVGGIVVMRSGENARATIDRVRTRLAELERGLPPGVAVKVGYDRADLIDRAVATLGVTLVQEIVVVAIITIVFLMHVRSALVAVVVLPVGVLATLGIMRLLGINANIMSLGGIAIAIGVMVDSSVVMVENVHTHLERERQRVLAGAAPRPHAAVVAEACREVGPTLFFSLLIITVSFVPVFALGDQSGRLFKPLAYTKTFAMAAGAVLAVTLIPVLTERFVRERVTPPAWRRPRRWTLYTLGMLGPAALLAFLPLGPLEPGRWWFVAAAAAVGAVMLLPQRFPSEERNPLSRLLEAIYEPAFALVMRFRKTTLLLAAAALTLTLYPLGRLGSEFMPPLEEGDLLYMPTTTEPGLSITKAREVLQQTDRLIATFPEVQSVMGKIGRAETATDPAPLNMIETTITLHRARERWRHVPIDRFFSDWPSWARWLPSQLWSTSRPITTDELVYGYELPGGRRVPGLNEVVQVPGLANAWTMPIRTRIDMLSTGIRTPVGVKVLGPDLDTLNGIAERIAATLRTDASTGPHTSSAVAEKTSGGSYLDLIIDRPAAARYGLSITDVQEAISTALGGVNVTQTIEGRERYPVNLRYPAELRDNLPRLMDTLLATPGGDQIPLALVARAEMRKGAAMLKSENARLTVWVYVDIAGTDIGTYVREARRAVAAGVPLPEGYTIVWSGQFEQMEKARERLTLIVPVAVALIVLLLYLATRSWLRVGIVLLAVPFSLIGAVWAIYLLDYNMSLAVWVGIIALAGLDAETGLVMLLYLDTSYEKWRSEGRMRNANDLWHAVHEGAVRRIRPKAMTVVTDFVCLMPVMVAVGAGSDTMRRLAAPMIGGLATSFVMELLVYPVLFFTAKSLAMRRSAR